MSKLNEDLRRELQDLCLEHGEISAEERIERLEILLKDHPEAQDEYCRLVLLDRLLKTEFNVDGVSFSPLLPGTPQPTNAATSLPVETADASSGTRKWQLGLIAASLAAAIAFLMPSLLTPSLMAPSGDGEAAQQRTATVDQELQALLPSLETIGMLHRVTRTSWERPDATEFVSRADLTLNLVEGAVRMPDFNGKESRGFVLKLPPGAALELTTYAEAAGKNALAIIGLDSHGQPTGQLVSFGNQPSTAEQADARIYGQLGTWSEVNDSNVDKYYLLTGLQQVDLPEEEPTWYVAEYSVFLNENDLLCIGWDDTGWSNQRTLDFPRDGDYNDITAIVHLSLPKSSTNSTASKVHVLPVAPGEVDSGVVLPVDSIERGYPVQVPPGERVIFNASGDRRYTNHFAVVNSKNGEVLWQKQQASGDDSLMGVFLIANPTKEPLDLRLVGHHVGVGKQEMLSLEPKLLFEDDFRHEVGFDESTEGADLQDMRVRLFWLNSNSFFTGFGTNAM